MKSRIILLGFVVLQAAFLFTGCKSDSKNNTDVSYDKAGLLKNLGENIIVPSYTDYSKSTADLLQKMTAFNAAPDAAKLTDLQNAYKVSYKNWQRVFNFEFGPASDNQLLNSSNIFPLNATLVESNITSGNYDLNSASNSDAKGFPALDYLLYKEKGDNVKQLALYTTDSKASGRKEYLKRVVEDLNTRAQKVTKEWSATGGNYVGKFTASTGSDIGSSIGLMVNGLSLTYERHTRDGKVGIPAGVRNIISGKPEPTRVEAFYEENMSIELALENLKSIENFMIGKGKDGVDGKGLYDYLDALGAKKNGTLLSKEMGASFAKINAKLKGLSGSMQKEVVSNQKNVKAVFDDMQELIVMIKVDMSSAFGVTITYADNDGD